MCDNPASVYVPSLRVARKAHQCMECMGEIEPGDTYEHIWGVWAEQGPDTFKTCMPCAERREEVKATLPRGETLCHGELADFLAACRLPLKSRKERP